MVHFGISYLEVYHVFEQRAGHWLLSEKVTRPFERAHRLFIFLFLCQKEAKFGKDAASGRFLPCAVGSHMSRPMGLLLGHWRGVTINASRLSVGFQGIQLVQLRNFWMVL